MAATDVPGSPPASLDKFASLLQLTLRELDSFLQESRGMTNVDRQDVEMRILAPTANGMDNFEDRMRTLEGALNEMLQNLRSAWAPRLQSNFDCSRTSEGKGAGLQASVGQQTHQPARVTEAGAETLDQLRKQVTSLKIELDELSKERNLLRNQVAANTAFGDSVRSELNCERARSLQLQEEVEGLRRQSEQKNQRLEALVNDLTSNENHWMNVVREMERERERFREENWKELEEEKLKLLEESDKRLVLEKQLDAERKKVTQLEEQLQEQLNHPGPTSKMLTEVGQDRGLGPVELMSPRGLWRWEVCHYQQSEESDKWSQALHQPRDGDVVFCSHPVLMPSSLGGWKLVFVLRLKPLLVELHVGFTLDEYNQELLRAVESSKKHLLDMRVVVTTSWLRGDGSDAPLASSETVRNGETLVTSLEEMSHRIVVLSKMPISSCNPEQPPIVSLQMYQYK